MGNKAYLKGNDYDGKVRQVIPYYDEILTQVTDIVDILGLKEISWLDTGGGSGTLLSKAFENFGNIKRAVLCDPSEKMLETAEKKLAEHDVEYRQCFSHELDYIGEFDVVTAIQCHHYYSDKEQKKMAVSKCYESLKDNGIYITFENTAPFTETGKNILLRRLEKYGLAHGREEAEVKNHSERYGTEFFPITVEQQLEMLRNCGFRTAEVFWLSYMQAGFYAIK